MKIETLLDYETILANRAWRWKISYAVLKRKANGPPGNESPLATTVISTAR